MTILSYDEFDYRRFNSIRQRLIDDIIQTIAYWRWIMYSLMLAIIYLIFISLGLPDSLLGSGWPTMQVTFGVPSSYAGYVSMAISFMTVISALVSPRMIRKFHTKWIVIVSILLTVMGIMSWRSKDSRWLLP